MSISVKNSEASTAVEIFGALAETHNKNASLADIYYCFRLLLGRDPNAEEALGHSQAAGVDLQRVVRHFLSSEEFAARNLVSMPQSEYVLVERDGYALFADPNDADVGRYVVAGEYEPHVTEVFRRFIQPGHTVVDIGANIGFFSALSAFLVGPSGHVVCIEANALNCRFLESTKRKNGFKWQDICAFAATAHKSLLTLSSGYSNGNVAEAGDDVGSIMRSTIVQGFRLDDVLKLDRLDFVKIDIEGHELDALMGFRENLARFQPVIVSEFTPDIMVDSDAYLGFFHNLGYVLSIINHDGTLDDFGQDSEALMDAYRNSGLQHIDILATILT